MALRRELVGEGGLGATGGILGCGLAVELVRGAANPPRHSERPIKGWAWLATARGGAAAKVLAGASVLGDAKGYGLRDLTQMKQEVGQRLTKGLDRRTSPAQGVDGDVRRRSRGSTRGGGSVAVLRAPGPRSSARGAPAIVPHGQGGPRVAGGEVIPRTRSHLRRRVRWNSRAGGLRSRE